jgi:hypothetical protein
LQSFGRGARLSEKPCRSLARIARALIQLCKVRPQLLSELGQGAIYAIAVKQLPAKLHFQPLDRIAERRLGDTATPGGAGKVPLFAERQKVSDLMQFHWACSSRTEM